MDKNKLLVGTAAVVILSLGASGIAYALGGDSGEQLTGPDAEKAKSAAIAAVGGGAVTEVEREDDGSAGGFEVEVKRDDGTQVEVHVGSDLKVVGQQADEDGPNDQEGSNDD